jgi:hypothetical protein
MTTTQSGEQILKTDALQRVRTPPERKELLLDEFERSGLSGKKYAAVVGMKYSTLAGWAAKRRRQRQVGPPAAPSAKNSPSLHWVEAVLDQTQGRLNQNSILTVQWRSGARLEIRHASQVELAAALLQALEKGSPSC